LVLNDFAKKNKLGYGKGNSFMPPSKQMNRAPDPLLHLECLAKKVSTETRMKNALTLLKIWQKFLQKLDGKNA
jgi:hypothetical protein